MSEETAPQAPDTEPKPNYQEVPRPHQTTPSPTPSKTSKSPLVAGLILLLILLLVGVAGYFFYQNYQLKQSLDRAVNQQTLDTTLFLSPAPSVVTPTTSPVEDQTRNWLTYLNVNTFYAFKYPQEISLEERDSVIILSLPGPTQKEDTEFYDGISLSFSYHFSLDSITLEEYAISKMEELKQHGQITKPVTEINIGQLSGYTFTASSLGEFEYIFLSSSDETLAVEIINGTSDPTGQGYQNIVDNILLTFAFTQ
ncbi:MAG: hypothetical protein PHX72_00265 [Candidatus Shapirobacteria bacterium]|nr:hypothetical protein [Candidatus Shapirobacteria bacterium]